MASKVDESNVAMADAGGIIDGSEIFKTNCAACHGTAGEGSVGPNLTDNYWLHGGDLTSVYKLIKVGAAEKGMKSWEAELSSVQIKNVASYIKTLGGTNPPNPKAPQGEEFNEGAAPSETTSSIDTTAKAPEELANK
jgi:cytochrome c oxidase cbb3-type subunit 3